MSSRTSSSNGSRKALSPERQKLAVRYIPLARRLARPWKRLWPQHWEDFDSGALFALVQAARCFDPSRNVKFSTFARHRIVFALRDVHHSILERRAPLDQDNNLSPELLYDPDTRENAGLIFGIEPEPPVGWELENSDALDRLLRKLPPKHAAACRQIYLLGKSQLEAARAIGLSQSRLCAMHRAALEMLGKSRTLGSDGASASPRPRASRSTT